MEVQEKWNPMRIALKNYELNVSLYRSKKAIEDI